MHKLESFALSTGTKISKPFIEKSFYPIVDKKFICVSKESVSNSKSYDFFDDVLFHIHPYLEAEGIKIIEIGKSKLPKAFYSKDLSNLNRLQTNYVINKSLLYIGNNNFYSNIASYYNKPTICPSNKDYIEIAKPYWGDSKIINPDIDVKPTFMNEEKPKTINKIQPEELSILVLDSLGIKHDLNKIKTIYTGDHYFNQVIDLVPCGSFPNQQLPNKLNVRMDKSYNLNFLLMCGRFKELNIVTDKVIPIEYLNQIKDSIDRITFIVSKKTKISEIKALESSGKKLFLITESKKDLNKTRLKFIDYQIHLLDKKTKKDLNVNVYSDLIFLSKRNIIFEGSMYNSYLSLSKKQNTSTVENSKEFWDDLSFCRVFKKTS